MRRGQRLLGACVAALSLAALPGTAPAAPTLVAVGSAEPPRLATSSGHPVVSAEAQGRLGTNLAEINYYSGAVIFNDLVRQAGDWVANAEGEPWGEGPPLRLRRDGWPASLLPGQVASTVIADVRYPAGRYTVSWSGSGTFTVGGRTFSGSAGSGSVILDGSGTVLLEIRSTDPDDPLRAIRVRVPGSAQGAVFRADYLDQLAPYAAVRFMDWQRTNSTFADAPRRFACRSRVTARYFSQGTSRGASVEVMVDLANALRVDPWFTIPHEASDGWIACHARVVAGRLAPGLTPRYEFSNETWNPAFAAFHDLTDQARQQGLGGGDAFLGVQILHARRHDAAMGIIAEAMGERPFLRVLAGQAANSWVLEQRLSHADSTDEIAIAPYLGIPGANPFDPGEATQISGRTPAQILAALATAQGEEVDAWVRDHVALAESSGTDLVAYEGGQHLAGDPGNDALTALFTRVNRSAGMGRAYRTYLARWRTLTGNALLMHFTDVGPATRFGSWGALEFPEQGSSPKYDELRRYAGR